MWSFVSDGLKQVERLEKAGAITLDEAASVRANLAWIANMAAQRVADPSSNPPPDK